MRFITQSPLTGDVRAICIFLVKRIKSARNCDFKSCTSHKSLTFRLACVLFPFLLSSNASAQFWQGAPTQPAQTWTLGGFGQFYFQPTEFVATGQVVYGVNPNFQLEGRLGFGTLDPYYGLFGKFGLLRRKALDISFLFGLHRQSITLLDAGLIIGHTFSHFQFYVGPYFEIPLQNGPPIGISMIPGFNFSIDKRMRFYTEYHLNMTNSYGAASAGVRWNM